MEERCVKLEERCVPDSGIPLRKLQLDHCTVSEVLRLHLQTSSGATPVLKTRSWFVPEDDPMTEFMRRYPHVLSGLARTSVFELSPGQLSSLAPE